MRKLYEVKTIKKDAHHMFTYEDGKKTPIPDDGVVYAYLAPETENGRMLKVDQFYDVAGHIDGKFVCTDEITEKGGKPCVDGVAYDIWGIGKDDSGTYVKESVRDDRFYIEGGNKITVSHPNKGNKKEAMEILYAIYDMLD